MERRKFVIGLGSLAAGGAAATGTGAFTSVTADRDAEIDLEDDADAYLGLVAGNDNGWAVQTAGGSSANGTMMIEMNGQSSPGGGGTGVSANAINVFDDVFRIQNQSNGQKYVWVEFTKSGGGGATADVDIDFYVGDHSAGPDSIVGSGEAAAVGEGNEIAVGIVVDTEDVQNYNNQGWTGHILEDVTIHAEDTDPSGGT